MTPQLVEAIRKLWPMLGSPENGEAGNAAIMLTRKLVEHGTDWHELLKELAALGRAQEDAWKEKAKAPQPNIWTEPMSDEVWKRAYTGPAQHHFADEQPSFVPPNLHPFDNKYIVETVKLCEPRTTKEFAFLEQIEGFAKKYPRIRLTPAQKRWWLQILWHNGHISNARLAELLREAVA